MKYALLLCLFNLSGFSQSFDIDDKSFEKEIPSESQYITLKGAIEAGLRKNFAQRVRNYTFDLNELDKKDNFANFWLPSINLTLNTSPHTIATLYESKNSSDIRRGPDGRLGIEIQDYTIFNWGRDYLDYINNRNLFKRIDQRLTEQKRDLRFNIIAKYFDLAKVRVLIGLAKKKLRHTSFVYRLAKEKISLKKIRRSEFLQAKAEFLKAHGEYHAQKLELNQIERRFATLISDTPSTHYTPTERLEFESLLIKPEATIPLAMKKNPSLLDAKLNYQNTKRSYQKALKENMPLPRISMRLAAYEHEFSRSGSRDEFEDINGNNNVELVASINMSWRLLGDGGFFNGRITKRAYLDKRISEIKYNESRRFLSVDIKTLHDEISNLENQYKALDLGAKNALKAFNQNLDDYIAGKIRYTDFKTVLDEYILNAQRLEESKYKHLVKKLDLAYAIGSDDLPGQRFESLGKRL